jgi:hypothetical protein
MDHSPSLVPSSSVVPRSLNLRRSPVLLSFRGPRTCLAHQSAFPFVHGSTHLCRSSFPTSSVPNRLPLPCCSSVPSSCTMCVFGGAVCTDLVNQLQYTVISDIISLLLPPTWLALVICPRRVASLSCCTS